MKTKSNTESPSRPEPARHYFTVEEANRALTYIGPIAADIRASWLRAAALQDRLDHNAPPDDAEQIRADYEQAVTTLNRFVEELHDAGIELKDYEQGLLDFPALHEGREISLCWRSGEATVHAWHEVHSGFAGRQEVSTLSVPAKPTKSNKK